MEEILDSTWVTIMMTLWTIYALFGDDIRMLATSKPADPVFYIFTLIGMGFFLLEIVLSCICKADYTFSFYFYLDVISTLTMIMDVGWIWNPIISGGSTNAAGQAKKVAQLARASRSARLGSKASKLVRVVRLIRMLRIVKLYKHTNSALVKEEGNEDDEFLEQIMKKGEDENDQQSQSKTMPEESRIGKVLSEVTTKKVICMVLIVMLSVPLFSYNTYVMETKSFSIGLDFITLYDSNRDGISFKQAFDSYVSYHKEVRTPLVFVAAQELMYEDPEVDYSDLRDIEKELVSPGDDSLADYYVAAFDLRADTRMEALFGILQTIFVCIMLTIGAFMFTKDATDLVIGPIEEMMGKVKRIAQNPLEAAKEEEKEAAALHQAEKERKEQNKNRCCKQKKEEITETKLLEQTIVKTGSLLAIGLGEAGSRIIAQNIADERSEGNIDPLLPGSKVYAIFGFCDIRNFTDTTEILQEEVMVFVNEVADIVHGFTHLYLGAPNKNIGDAFLLVWKFLDEDVENVNGEVRLKNSPTVNALADMAAFAFLLVIAAVNKSKKLAKYRKYEALNARMPDYRVKMGYGIHAGWAIEGAIGSEYKIDASYISPHVNLTMALEEATKIYGVPFVISHHYFNLISKEVQDSMRPLDRVVIHGFEEVTTIYTYDVDIDLLEVEDKGTEDLDKDYQIFHRIRARDRRDAIYKGMVEGKFRVKNKFKTNRDIKKMHSPFTQV
eukprot:TRINITY_DN6_c0_g1_i2.p3 TRINITY_DN6_c0_g1~~TRINITY_DN6_c0_g1_i2.p3  ORF type:complete len:725 (-),score=113.15 TRINITY_DN6_c0_g1_i2:12502-14676(-)